MTMKKYWGRITDKKYRRGNFFGGFYGICTVKNWGMSRFLIFTCPKAFLFYSGKILCAHIKLSFMHHIKRQWPSLDRLADVVISRKGATGAPLCSKMNLFAMVSIKLSVIFRKVSVSNDLYVIGSFCGQKIDKG